VEINPFEFIDKRFLSLFILIFLSLLQNFFTSFNSYKFKNKLSISLIKRLWIIFCLDSFLTSEQAPDSECGSCWHCSDQDCLCRRVIPCGTGHKALTESQNEQEKERNWYCGDCVLWVETEVVGGSNEEGNQGHEPEDTEAEESDKTVFERVFLIGDELEFFDHHYAEESSFVGAEDVDDFFWDMGFEAHIFVDGDHLLFFGFKVGFHFLELSFFFRLHVLIITFSGKVISNSHGDSISNQRCKAEGNNMLRINTTAESEAAQCYTEGSDKSIQTTINSRFDKLSSLDVFLVLVVDLLFLFGFGELVGEIHFLWFFVCIKYLFLC
jgi:hypothetical protein